MPVPSQGNCGFHASRMRMLRKEEEEGTNVVNLDFVRFSVIDCVFHLRLLPWCSVILLLSVFIENIN